MRTDPYDFGLDPLPDATLTGAARRRISAFDAERVRLCCSCQRCHLCGFIQSHPPPVAGLRVGGILFALKGFREEDENE